MSEKKPLPGADLLRAHLKRTGQTAEEFAETSGVERTLLSRLLGGEQPRQRVAVPTAARIQDASGGDVPMRSWDPGWVDPNEVADQPTKRPSGTFAQVSADALPTATAIYDSAKATG